ncbi:MAG TPA: ATP-binding cassette domain-containing protein, partial [Polyangiaceae bacterium]|nr:ATP-binding cassette domain-containing protein [Polyangiaceae bacterium]
MPAGLLHVSFYVARQKRRLVFALVASSLALSLGHAGLAWAAARLLWALLTPGRAPGPLGALALGALAAAALKALGATLLAGAEALFVAAVALDYRRRLVGALLGRGTRRADEAAIARLLAALAALERACAAGLFGGLRALLHLVPVVAVALRFTPWFALGFGLAWAPLLFVLGRARKRLRRGEADALGRSARVAHRVDEIFRHVDLWRTHGAGRSLARALERDAHEVGRASSSAAALRASLSGLNEVMAAAAVALVVALGPRVAGGAGAPGLEDTVVFLALVFWAYRPFRDWLDARAAWQGGRAALELLEPWLEPEREAAFEPPSHHDVAGEADDPVGPSADRADLNGLANAEGETVGQHVGPPAEARDAGVVVVPASVAPSGGGPFVGRAPLAVRLERFGARRHHARWSLTLRPGSLVVIAGPTGAGKTTLVRALLGLEEARGGLWYGGTSLRGAGVGPLARPFAWAPQGAPLVAGTLADNLLPAEGVSPREAWASLAALRGAGAPSWREDEPLGAVDRQLSGGER